MNSKQRNYLIIGLCAVVLLMVVGYAAFSTELNITSTAGTTSKWDVRITNATTHQIVGTATNAEGSPSYDNTDGLTASFSSNLVSPGDSITYKITIANQGNIDAVLSNLSLPASTNPAINFIASGFGIGTDGNYKSQVLTAGATDDLYIKVEYDSSVTSQPTILTEDYTVTLDFEQYVGTTGGDIGGDTGDDISLTTVYAWHTDSKYIGTDTITDGVADYTTLGKNAFLKYEIDSNNVIQNAYACQKFTFIDEPVCLQGSTDGSTYSANQAILTNLQPTFEANGGSCSLNDVDSDCSDSDFRVSADSSGYVYSYDKSAGSSCDVTSYGIAYCSRE